jgi:hypothetical protein
MVVEDGWREDWDEIVDENRPWILPEAKVSMRTDTFVERERNTSYIIKLWSARAEYAVWKKNFKNVRYLKMRMSWR